MCAQRAVVDAVRASPINWSSPWNKIPPNLKADLYATVSTKNIQTEVSLTVITDLMILGALKGGGP
jgi:hypothetical protein